ncbi:flagellin [[Roseibacterium] beibuensis]|uniref:flagellin n=1 Tax=[Roseibacterium] beibuensis TaxID=1193142 RepID=UPI002877FF66|nr:flagellin [Roseibacterium beibuensis]
MLRTLSSKTLPAAKMASDTLKEGLRAMALNSVNTNVGAMIALQNLSVTNSELSTVQNRINTGKIVSSAKDNGAIFAIAQGQRAELGALNAVKDSLNRGQSAVDVALSAGESVSDLLTQLKEKALSATDKSLTTSARSALNEDFKAIRDQIATVVSNAKFNGVNLIDNSTGTAGFKALSNTAGSTIKAAPENLSLGGANVSVTATMTIGTSTLAGTALTAVNNSIDKVSASLARLGTASKSFGTHLTFVGKLQDSIEAGIGNLVDADLAKESARLQALQTKQQLGVQALSIANSSTSILLGLFR